MILLSGLTLSVVAQTNNQALARINQLNVSAKAYLKSYPDSTLLLGQRALEMAKQNDFLEGVAASSCNLGGYQQYRGHYKDAYKYYLGALKIYEKLQHQPGLAQIYNHLGDVYRKQKNYQEAQTHYQRSLKLYQQLNRPVGIVENLNNLGDNARKQQRLEEALRFYFQSLKIAQTNHDLQGMMGNWNNLGDVFDQQQKYSQAIENYQQALEVAHQLDSKLDIAENLSSIGRVHSVSGNHEDALKYLQESIDIAKKYRFLEELRDAYKAIAAIYLKTKNFEQTFHYYRLFSEIKDTLYNTKSLNEIAQLRRDYESGQQTQKIALLQRDKKLSRISSYMLIGGIIFLLVIGVLGFYWQRSKISKNQELLEQNQRIYETQQELIEAELSNAQLNEQKLKTELENKRLKEQQLQYTLETQNKSLTSHALLIIQKNKMLSQVKEKLWEIVQTDNRDAKKRLKQVVSFIGNGLSFDKDWQEFKTIFEQVHEDFFEKLKATYPDLTSTEIRLCALLKLNLNSKDIATIMGISQDSLRIARYRLRKKLQLPKGSNLISFILNI
ncbi:hypothetical protein BKI52_35855 [marine bacterium AO1-C]|nr:hypothetical protein BKI52_35855 [marine bacterium AO1-C]